MIRIVSLIAALFAVLLCACAEPAQTDSTTAPNPSQVAAIKNVCSVIAALEPTIAVLISMSDLVTDQERAAVAVAHAVVEPICTNPEGNASDNARAAVASATGQLVAIITQVEQRRRPHLTYGLSAGYLNSGTGTPERPGDWSMP